MKKIEAKLKVHSVERGIQAGNYTKTLVVFDDSFGERKSYIPVTFFGEKADLIPADLKKGDTCEIEFYLKGREWQGKYFLDSDGVALSVVGRSSEPSNVEPARDFKKQLEYCKTLDQLQSVWQSIPPKDKPTLESLKNKRKSEILSSDDEIPF